MGELDREAGNRLLNAIDGGADVKEMGFDIRSVEAHAEGQAAARLELLRSKCIGNFKTHVRCHCPAHVIDHATEDGPSTPSSLRDVCSGEAFSKRAELAIFRIQHHYWCDACGLKYEASIIEGNKGWVPRERCPEFAK